MPCKNSSWIMDSRIYGEGRTQIPLSSHRIDKVYTDIRTANNNKINRTMVSFTDHYNTISLDRLSSKTKTGKD